MTQDLNLHPDFPFVVGYFRQRTGEEITLQQLAELVDQTTPEELCLVFGPESVASIGVDIAAIRSEFADTVLASDVLNYLALKEKTKSTLAPTLSWPEEKWQKVQQGLNQVYSSILWFIILVTALVVVAALCLVLQLSSPPHFGLFGFLVVAGGLLAAILFVCYLLGQIKCCAIPDDSGARGAMVFNAILLCIGFAWIIGLVIAVATVVLLSPDTHKSVPQRVSEIVTTPEMSVSMLGIRLIFPIAHVVFVFALIRMCDHLKRRGVALFGTIFLIVDMLVTTAGILLPFLMAGIMNQAAASAKQSPATPPAASVAIASLAALALLAIGIMSCILQIVFLVFVGSCRQVVKSALDWQWRSRIILQESRRPN